MTSKQKNIIRYKPLGLCMNDFDALKVNDLYHLIHLQGPPIYPFDATCLETSYGHIVSKDLIKWEPKPPIFGVSDQPHFDDSGIWTMHIIHHNKKYWMFYTGLNHRTHFQQQVGLAISEDSLLEKWKRYSEESIVSADPRYYQTEEDMAWRDPFVIFDEKRNLWLMYIAAKHNSGPKETRGCIGLAVSEDLINWEVKPPVVEAREYFEMECPVVHFINDAYYMFVSVSNDYRVYSYKATGPLGPYEPLGVLTQPNDYAPRIIQDNKNKWVLLHTVKRRWKNEDSGEFMRGMLAQPKHLKFDEKGIPYLAWYSEVEKYLESVTADRGKNGLLEIAITEAFNNIIVHLRLNEDDDKLKGVELLLTKEMVELRYIEDKYTLRKEEIIKNEKILNLKILLFNEYYEIYLNDRLIISTLGYRYMKGQFKAVIDGKSQQYSFREFK